MARSQKTRKEFPLIVSALNMRADRSKLRPGELSLAFGLDGRVTGALRKFPGFGRTKDLTDINGSLASVVDIHYVTLQKGTTAFVLRGFLVLHNDGSNVLEFFYYDEDPGVATWATYDISTISVTSSSKVSTAGPARFCYIAVDGEAPQVIWATGTAGVAATINQDAMGPGNANPATSSDGEYDTDEDGTVLAAPTYDAEYASGHLLAGTYLFMYRLYDSDRDVYSGRSALLERAISADDKYIKITNPDADPDRAYDAGYDELHVYRTMSASVGGSSYQAGLMYREHTYDLDSGVDCWPASVPVGDVMDAQLIYNDVFDPLQDVPGSPPSAGTVAYKEGVTFMGSDRSGGSVVTQLQWSQLARFAPEVFPAVNHHYRWDVDDGQIIRFEHAGDMLYAFAEGAAYRIAKSSGQLLISKMQGGRSIVNRKACATLGRDIIGVTPLGVTIFDGESGGMNTIGALDRLIMEDWVDEWDDIFVVNDNILGCSYIVSPDDEQAALIWHVTGAVTMLDDCQWAAGCSGPDPTTGGRSRAFFVTSAGVVTTADENRGDNNHGYTMNGMTILLTLNGTASAGGDTTHLIDSGATYGAIMVGTKIYIFESDGSYGLTTVSAVDVGNDKLTLTDAQSEAPDGKRYCVDPIPFRVRLWPITPAGGSRFFTRRIASGMGLFSAGHVVPGVNPNTVWRMGLCRRFEDTPSGGLAVIDMDENPDNQWSYPNVHGASLEPWIEQISARTDFRLLVVGVDVIMNTGRKLE